MFTIKLNQALQRIEVAGEIESELAFPFFDALPEGERASKFLRALQIGVLALQQDRLSTFLARTENELGTELEALKMRFDLKAELYDKSTVKGTAGENQIAEYLVEFFDRKGLKDSVSLTGNSAGMIPKNKTGDIVCELNDAVDRRIAIECKFDKGVTIGQLSDRDWFGKNSDTAWGQLIEAKANRDANEAIIVFDRASANAAIIKLVDGIAYVPSIGFIVIVDSLRGDFDNLGAAFLVARSLATANPDIDCDHDLLRNIVARILKDLTATLDIKKLVQQNIANSQAVLDALHKSQAAIEFSQQYLTKFLRQGTLTKADLLEFYTGGDVKTKYAILQSDIAGLIGTDQASPSAEKPGGL